MKGTEHFKTTIKTYLDQRAEEDPLFADTYGKEGKTLDGCINYIFEQVRKIGAQGYTDDEIYNLAVHYYDEGDLKEAKPMSCNVVVNHKPELTDQEKQELKEQARKEVLAEERERLAKKSKPTAKKETANSQMSLL